MRGSDNEVRARELPPSPAAERCRPLTSSPAPLIYLPLSSVLRLWKVHDDEARFQRAQPSGRGESTEEKGQGSCLAEGKAHVAEREVLRWEGVSEWLQAPKRLVPLPSLVQWAAGFCWKLKKILQMLLGTFLGLDLPVQRVCCGLMESGLKTLGLSVPTDLGQGHS